MSDVEGQTPAAGDSPACDVWPAAFDGRSVVVVADAREAGSATAQALAALPGVDFRLAHLEVGDYLVAPEVVVERKGASDFAQSVIDGRLFRQVQEMHHHYGRVVVLVEGEDLYERLTPAAIRGALAYLAAAAGVSVLRSRDTEESAGLLLAMARLAQRPDGGQGFLFAKRRALTFERQQLRVAHSLPGIGPVLADALLRHFGTLEQLFQANEKALREVPGIGPTLARRVRAISSRPYTPVEEALGEKHERGQEHEEADDHSSQGTE